MNKEEIDHLEQVQEEIDNAINHLILNMRDKVNPCMFGYLTLRSLYSNLIACADEKNDFYIYVMDTNLSLLKEFKDLDAKKEKESVS